MSYRNIEGEKKVDYSYVTKKNNQFCESFPEDNDRNAQENTNKSTNQAVTTRGAKEDCRGEIWEQIIDRQNVWDQFQLLLLFIKKNKR